MSFFEDVEGRSALLLGRAKDNNGSAAIGPLVRLIDDSFTLQDAQNVDIKVRSPFVFVTFVF